MSIVLVTALALTGSARANSTTIAIYPDQLEVDVGDSYIINVTVADVTDLYMWVFMLRWNNSILELESIAEGPFLKQGGATFFTTIPSAIDDINAAGRIDEATCAIVDPGGVGVNGGGVLATLNFTALVVGTSAIELLPPTGEEATVLINSNDEEIPHAETDGRIDVIPEFSASVLITLLLLMALVVAALKKTVWSTGRRAVDAK